MWNIILDERERIVFRQDPINGNYMASKFQQVLAFKQASLQEYHKGILNMHLHLLLMRYESVRLLTVNVCGYYESLQQQGKCAKIGCEFRREGNSTEIPENIHLDTLRADFVKRFEIGQSRDMLCNWKFSDLYSLNSLPPKLCMESFTDKQIQRAFQ